MGIPYSREINAAFDQVTPLVAEVDRILRTLHNIAIIVAIIQVLTVLLLFAIFIVLVMILYSLNPDLEEERQKIITPLLRYLASIRLLSVVKTVVVLCGLSAAGSAAMWRFFRAKQWVEDVEYEGNVEAERRALAEEAEEAEEREGKNGKGGNKGKKKTKK